MTDAVFALAVGLWPALVGGALLGFGFYSSLWWTVRRGLPSPRAGLWFFASMLLRTGVGLVGIYMIGDGQWARLATCLLGFVMARQLVLWLTRDKSMPLARVADLPRS